MDCKEMILSEDTYDIITDFSASEFLGDDNNCYERIGEDFLILYLGNLGTVSYTHLCVWHSTKLVHANRKQTLQMHWHRCLMFLHRLLMFLT